MSCRVRIVSDQIKCPIVKVVMHLVRAHIDGWTFDPTTQHTIHIMLGLLGHNQNSAHYTHVAVAPALATTAAAPPQLAQHTFLTPCRRMLSRE